MEKLVLALLDKDPIVIALVLCSILALIVWLLVRKVIARRNGGADVEAGKEEGGRAGPGFGRRWLDAVDREINKLRARSHDQANVVQELILRVAKVEKRQDEDRKFLDEHIGETARGYERLARVEKAVEILMDQGEATNNKLDRIAESTAASAALLQKLASA